MTVKIEVSSNQISASSSVHIIDFGAPSSFSPAIWWGNKYLDFYACDIATDSSAYLACLFLQPDLPKYCLGSWSMYYTIVYSFLIVTFHFILAYQSSSHSLLSRDTAQRLSSSLSGLKMWELILCRTVVWLSISTFNSHSPRCKNYFLF